MSIFGLVHGAGLGAWCWERLVDELGARGHEAAVVDLPLYDPSASAAQLADIILDAFAAIDLLALVGHSISGLVVPLVAARRRVSRLIFLHAVLPEPGKSLVEQVSAEPDMFNPEMMKVSPAWWSDEAIATRFLFHDCSPAIAREACTRLRPGGQGRGVLVTESTPLEAWPRVPCAYIVCNEDRTARPDWARRAARERLGVDPIGIPGGHCPMISRPAELAVTLERCL
jgi:pimeloyl-ACP methyl ester carboxylesterase